jgi:hypothetical protein
MYWVEKDLRNGRLQFRFVNDAYYIYYMHNIILRDELLQGLSLYMNIYDIENDVATKEDLIQKFRKEPKEIAKFLRTSIRKVPGTSTHSKFLRKICLSLLNAKGSPTIFFTVSFANTRN